MGGCFRFQRAWIRVGAAAAVMISAGAVSRAQTPPVPVAPMVDRITQYAEDENAVDRFYYIPWSEARFARRQAFLSAAGEGLKAVNFDSLAKDGQVDYLLLRNHLRHQQAMLDLAKRRLAEIDEALPFRPLIVALEEARWRLEPVKPEDAATRVSEIPGLVKAARARVEKGRKAEDATKSDPSATPDAQGKAPAIDADGPIKLSATAAKRAASVTGSLRWALENWYEHRDGFEPEFSWWLRKPYEDARKSLSEYEEFLRKEVAGLKGEPDDPLVGDPIGPEALAADFAREHIAYSAEELIAIAEREFAWCEAEARKAATELGKGEDWKAAVEHVKGKHAPAGGQDDLMGRLAREGAEWVTSRDLVTVPPLNSELWRITMLSPGEQRTLPFAAYGRQSVLTAYATDGMKHEDKLMSMRGNNEHFSRIVAPHELIPGHHLQGHMASRVRPHRQLFSTPFFVEGWALYWEMLLWDMDYARGPEDRVGMLFWRMHRCARIIVSLKYELGQMTPAQMIDFLVDRVGHERANATSEVRRYIGGDYSPLYQVGYMIGGLQLRALAKELVDSGKLTRKQFNDDLLTHGSIPPELIRAEMIGEPMTPDQKPQWRFDDWLKR